MASTELPKHYDFASLEEPIYERWLQSGYFNPDKLPNQSGEPFCIMMPPPNVTGVLHAGHAMFLTIQDIFIRYARMQGRRALWLPGTDHAAIATQARVEKDIDKKEGKSRYDLGREELLRRIDEFVANHRTIITDQIRRVGASCDWSREAFTLDEPRTQAVNEAFKRLYDLGLIYHGHRIVNWDPKGQTTISDDEIVYQERPAKFWTFRYSRDFPISISTTRPETKVGDTAVAVHPDDKRYKEYVGKEYDIVFCDIPLHIAVVADETVDPEFGTGAVGVTPAHSPTDWDIAQRHDLPVKQVIDERACMTVAGQLNGKKTTKAREEIVAWLNREELMEKEEEVTQNVATAERTGGIIEPLPKLQWFIGVNRPFAMPHSELEGITTGEEVTLKRLMRHVVESDQIRIVPERFADTYFRWIDNLRDWCISRQIWYGHRIPVWYHEPECVPKQEQECDVVKCGQTKVSATQPVCEFCDAQYVQDEDTLDTWFSSGLWTFSTLGWPEKTQDLETFHPTDLMETAYEILFFWVARMVLMSTTLTGQVPFRTVYLHGLVRDEKRRKLSKSKSDSADPLDLIANYGADALRMALIFNTSPGTDSVLSDKKIRGMKNFANKLWNIARYVLTSVPVDRFHIEERPKPATDADRAILEELDRSVTDVNTNLEHYAIHEAAQIAYHFVWHELADKYVEASKLQLQDPALTESTGHILAYCLTTILKILHPFMPFVTEELWGRIHGTDDPAKLLIVQAWPR